MQNFGPCPVKSRLLTYSPFGFILIDALNNNTLYEIYL